MSNVYYETMWAPKRSHHACPNWDRPAGMHTSPQSEKRKTRWNKHKMGKLEPEVPRPKRVVEDKDEVEDSSSDADEDGVEG
ncbi:hypothetical protein OBBRIDRAFT_840463 [Obba rivulosa]|uniref:Uncharacterized protein n=1 Tax=Obba rivulosa TaxID=1052685 RepID=A0A8E2DF85_9APHY|nr:hypothetical protein OBBRIDRAFT_840463 [Obba rivulosa]